MPQELVLDFDVDVSEGRRGFVDSLQVLGSFRITVLAPPDQDFFFITMRHDGPAEFHAIDDCLGDLCIQVDLLYSCGDSHSQSTSNLFPELKVAGFVHIRCSWPVNPFNPWSTPTPGFVTANGKVRMRVQVRGDFDDLRKWPVLCQSDLLRRMWLDRGREDFYIEARGGEEVKCHRSVVAAASDVFDNMLHSGCQEGWMPFIKVHDSVEEVLMLLEFLYTGELPLDISSPMLLSLLRLADFYQVPTLAGGCAKRIGPLLSESNVVQVFQALQPLRHVNKAYDDMYRSMMEHVRDNRYRNLLEVLCMSSMQVAPQTQNAPSMPTSPVEQATQLTMKHEKDLSVWARDQNASEEQKGSSKDSQSASLQRSGAVTSGIAETLASNESRSSGNLADAMPATSPTFGTSFHASQSSHSISQSRPAPAEAAMPKRRTRRGGSKKTKRAPGQAAQSTMSVPGTHNSFED